jgi:hypothetical protein
MQQELHVFYIFTLERLNRFAGLQTGGGSWLDRLRNLPRRESEAAAVQR